MSISIQVDGEVGLMSEDDLNHRLDTTGGDWVSFSWVTRGQAGWFTHVSGSPVNSDWVAAFLPDVMVGWCLPLV